MNKNRTIVLFGTIGLLALLFVSWTFVLSGRMSNSSDIDAQRSNLEQQNRILAQRVTSLENQKNSAQDLSGTAAGLSRRFPATLDQKAIFSAIRSAAAQAGLPENAVTTLTTGAPSLGAGGASPSEAPATDGSAADGSDGAAATTPAAGQIASVSVDITVTASAAQATRFLNNLEGLDQAFLVSQVDASKADDKTGAKSINIQGTMFLLPQVQAPATQ